MSDIIVAGLGHGGLVAAIKLAESGHNVTVISEQWKNDCGLEQKDALDAKALDFAGFDIPDKFRAPGNVITFVPLGKDTEKVTLPANDSYENLTVDRKEFLDFFIEKAENAGVRFIYGCRVTAPVILGSRVAGVKTTRGNFYSDLVIDACGVNSLLRRNMPEFTMITRNYETYDVLHAYRAYFRKKEGATEPDTKYNLYLKDDGVVGLSWLVTEEDAVDVLVARFHETDYGDIADALLKISRDNPHMDSVQIRGGRFRDIPVRQPMSVLVADGYAAVGDSAFMTYAVKGSGLAYSIKAGKLLADAVIDDTEGLFNCDTLWEYQKNFFKEIGFDACRIALAKNLLPYLTAKEVDDMFRSGLVSTEELTEFMTGSLITILKSNPIALIREKLRILSEYPETKAHIMMLIGWIGKFTVIEPSLPSKYDRREVKAWAEKYDGFFDEIRRKD